MSQHEAETRAVTLVDIPLVNRLVEYGVVLDNEVSFTRAGGSPSSALFSSFFLPQRGLHTLMAKADSQQVVGQFRLRADETHARIVYIAPALDYGVDDTAWLHVLDAMAADAGKRGAYMLTAEVDEGLDLFQTMRISGFSIYARQEIWQRHPDEPLPTPDLCARLTRESEADAHGIQLLYSNIVPRLVQQIAMPPGHSSGLVYRKNDRIEGYIALTEGKSGIYLMPYLHPDVFSEAGAIITAAINHADHPDRVPVYVCVRRYQDWLEDALNDLGFEPLTRQAVMVRHIAAGVRSTSFASLAHRLEVAPSPIKPPTITEPVIDHMSQE
jgi:hypothetical protein